jgi:RimJ/RimL family protein N-acetyltransferase
VNRPAGDVNVTLEVTLREVSPQDLAIFFEQQRDPAANEMAAFPARGREAFDEHWKKILADDSITKRTILLGEEVAGNIGCFEQFGERQIGYWLGRRFWGRGIASRALRAFLGVVEYRPLFARVVKHNVASFRVLEKCGFVVLGENREASNERGEEIVEYILKLE